MKIDNSNGWTEAIIDENCSAEMFYKIAAILHSTLDIAFTNKISNLDSIYWDFIYKDVELTLHYNNYIGVLIFPKALANATVLQNKTVTELGDTFSKL